MGDSSCTTLAYWTSYYWWQSSMEIHNGSWSKGSQKAASVKRVGRMKLLLLFVLLTGCTIVEDSELYCRTKQRCNCRHHLELDSRYPSHTLESRVNFKKIPKEKVPIYEYRWIPPLYGIHKTGWDSKGDPTYELKVIRQGEHKKKLKGYRQ